MAHQRALQYELNWNRGLLRGGCLCLATAKCHIISAVTFRPRLRAKIYTRWRVMRIYCAHFSRGLKTLRHSHNGRNLIIIRGERSVFLVIRGYNDSCVCRCRNDFTSLNQIVITYWLRLNGRDEIHTANYWREKKKQLSYVDYESVLRFDIYIYAILTSSYFFFMN